MSSTVIPHICSNHSLLLIYAQNDFERYGPLVFHFMRIWFTYVDFRNIIKKSWEKPMEGGGLFCLAKKLKHQILILRKWNAEIFGRVDQNIQHLEDGLVRLESKSISSPSLC